MTPLFSTISAADASQGALKFSDQRESLEKEHSIHIVKLSTKMSLIKTSNEGTLLKTLMLHLTYTSNIKRNYSVAN